MQRQAPRLPDADDIQEEETDKRGALKSAENQERRRGARPLTPTQHTAD